MNTLNAFKILIALTLFLLMLLQACTESLPPRNDPSILFEGYFSSKYSLLWNENVLRIEVALVNIFDETVQAKALMSGTVEVVLVRNTAYRKTIHFDASHLITRKFYNSTTKEVTINPGDTIRFVYVWNFIDDNNVNLPTDVFHYYQDQTCTPRYIAYSESFALTGSFQLIEKLGSVRLIPAVINLCYIQNYFSPKDCSAPPTECNKR
jgi:signal peptidase I